MNARRSQGWSLAGAAVIMGLAGEAFAGDGFTLIAQHRRAESSAYYRWAFDTHEPVIKSQESFDAGPLLIDLKVLDTARAQVVQNSVISSKDIGSIGSGEYAVPNESCCGPAYGYVKQEMQADFKVTKSVLVRFKARIPNASTSLDFNNSYDNDYARIKLRWGTNGGVFERAETYPYTCGTHFCLHIDEPTDKTFVMEPDTYRLEISMDWNAIGHRDHSAYGLVNYEVMLSVCRADFNGDTFVTADDFDAFVDAFVAGESSADFNSDGFVTGDDFDSYVAGFESGC